MAELPDLDQVKTYFDKCIQEHGASPRGSDWNGEASQNLRFDQILKVIEGPGPCSLLDYGCGYGALADYMLLKGFDAEYVGFDILESVVETARKTHTITSKLTFTFDKTSLAVCDYTVSSGIFNYRGENSFEAWTEHTIATLREFDALSRRGFSSNFLTKYSDSDRKRADLYYADPLFIFDFCKKNFARNVALLHDYRLYDFTIIVRKD